MLNNLVIFVNYFIIVSFESETLNYGILELPGTEWVEHKIFNNETNTLCTSSYTNSELLYKETSFVNLVSSRNYKGIFTNTNYTALEETGYVNLWNEIDNFTNEARDDFKDAGVVFDLRKREDAYSKTSPSDYPYSVLLVIHLKCNALLICTGSLITEEWVLTAAHCIFGAVKHVTVYAGGNSFEELQAYHAKKTKLPPTAQVELSKEVIPHPRYREIPDTFDVGLVKVMNKFKITDAVKVVKVSNKPWNHRGYVPCVITAFGRLFMNKKTKEDLSRKTQRLEVKKPCLCSFMLKTVFSNIYVSKQFICAKPRQDYGVCVGDSGGGLVCDDEGEDKIRGINAMVLGFGDVKYCIIDTISLILGLRKDTCGSKDSLSIVLDTCPFLPWINQYVNLFSENDLSECRDFKATLSTVESVHWKCHHLILILSYFYWLLS